MTRYTVTWMPDVQRELTQLWLDAENRNAVTAASNEIDRLLAVDADSVGNDESEGLRRLVVHPLSALFSVEKDDLKVAVVSIRLLL